MIHRFDKKKIGIMGGTFDPIHTGHLLLAEHAYEQFHLDSVFFMPTGNPPHKVSSQLTSIDHRVSMIEAAIADNFHFELSRVELERDGTIFTYKTLELLKHKDPMAEYFFIMGADSLFDFEKWKYPERVASYCTILVATREDYDSRKLDIQIQKLSNKYQADIYRLFIPNFDISSNLIREKVRNGKSIRYFVPKEVEFYINENELYKER